MAEPIASAPSAAPNAPVPAHFLSRPSVCARLAIEVPQPVDGKAPRKFMWMPAGTHTICATCEGQDKTVTVAVNQETARAAQAALEAWQANDSRRPFFDFDHKREAASAWPERFSWSDLPKPGVYVEAAWSEAGQRAVVGRNYRGFSPEFYLDREEGSIADPARVVFFPLSAGGLTNKPAFQKNNPLWAAQPNPASPANLSAAPAADKPNKKQTNTNSMLETVTQAPAQVAAADNRDSVISDLRSRLDAADKAIAAQRKKDATAAVQAAVKRGALPAQDHALHTKWEQWCADNPEMVSALEALPGQPALQAGQITAGQPARISAAEGPQRLVKAYAAKMAESRRITGMDPTACASRGAIARDAAAIYRDITKDLKGVSDMPIAAATSTDADLGSMAGDLVTQRTLELLKFQFPVLNRITTDFSDQPIDYGQTVITRILTVPTITTYNTSTGWTTPGSNPTATDKSVTINQHKGVPIRFQENQLGGTMRRLFDEFAPAAAYCLAKNIVDTLYAVITTGNFTNTPTVADASSFGRAEVIDMGTALTLRGAPMGPMNRSLLLYSTYFGALAKDSAIVTLAAFQRPGIIEEGTLPNVHGFGVVDAPNLSGTAGTNVVGFAFSKSALILAARLPNDYSSILPGSSNGTVTTITNPDIGLSVMQVQYVDHKLGFAESRIALMYGVAAGQDNAGQLLKSVA